jgi:hypothetical protein
VAKLLRACRYSRLAADHTGKRLSVAMLFKTHERVIYLASVHDILQCLPVGQPRQLIREEPDARVYRRFRYGVR